MVVAPGIIRVLGDAIKLEVIGLVCDENRTRAEHRECGAAVASELGETAPIVMIAGTSMNSGKTYAATELIKQATRAGLKVAAAKLSGVACLRDTLNMADHGAVATASFLDCGLPSTVDVEDLAPMAKAIIARLNEVSPDLIVIELGDGILGGYSVDTIFNDAELLDAMSALVFCASDYVGAWGGIELLRRRGVAVDVVSGSVTDSRMGGDYITTQFNVPAANARREGETLFELVMAQVKVNKPAVVV